MFRMLVAGSIVAAVLAAPASAAVFVVSSVGNASTGGAGLATVSLDAGQAFRVSVAADDLWSAGALPRWSNANGLTGNLLATGSDESGETAGTLIGRSFGAFTQSGHSAPYGALVGRIGGVFQTLGTSFNGTAWSSGTLELFYWDSNNNDNFGSVATTISLVPEPASWLMLVAGFGLVGMAARRRQPGSVLA